MRNPTYRNEHATTAATALLVAALLPSCRTIAPEVQAPLRASVDALLAPETLVKLQQLPVALQAREYIVPDAAIAAYAKALGRSNFGGETTATATQISRDRLTPPKLLATFREVLSDAGFQQPSIDLLEQVFRSPKVIAIAERAVSGDRLPAILAHERFHRAMKELPSELYQHMMEVAGELKQAVKPGSEDYLLEERDPTDSGFIIMAARTGSLEEIFAYMADGKFTPAAEDKLRELSPRAYQTFEQLRAMTR